MTSVTARTDLEVVNTEIRFRQEYNPPFQNVWEIRFSPIDLVMIWNAASPTERETIEASSSQGLIHVVDAIHLMFVILSRAKYERREE